MDLLHALTWFDLTIFFLLLGTLFLYVGMPMWIYSLLLVAAVIFYECSILCQSLVIAILVCLHVPIVRRWLISFPVLFLLKAFNVLPAISQTEKDAIESGSVWMDAELFSGSPDFKKILSEPYPELTHEEQDFLDGPVDKLCDLVIDWDVYKARDFSENVWDFIKKERFFGMIIPKKYGGLEFSALANSAVISKLSSRSTPLGITVMVPNSLGPAELLVHYGTDKQKEYYLPRLAIGDEIPCFALTESGAGSDAGSMTSNGEIFKNDKDEICIRLNWKKRYITLAAKATLLGLAFKLSDPNNLLGKGEDLGITCALIPTSTEGVVVGDRHDPLGVPFYNCPTEGHDVVVTLDAVIGGKEGVGRGWKMLMECLSAGRGISLPANCSGGAKYVSRVVGAYTMIRKQFGLEIGKFEGIHEPVSEISGWSYILEAARKYTCGALDSGAKPAVVSAIAKYHFTEIFRKIINHGMDVLGGAAISLGPRNLLGHAYIACPIGVTVEGANILTRTLMIFGQGAIRCHKYVLDEIHAIEENNLKKFDKAFWGHQLHAIRNLVRSIILGLTRGFIYFPPRLNATWRYYQKLAWVSARFAFYSDVVLAYYGGGLKRKERITARFGDILSWMYLATSVLRRYEAEGCLKEDLPFVEWSMDYSFNMIQTSFESVFDNMGPLFFFPKLWSRLNPIGRYPSDKVSMKIANIIQKNTDQRERLTKGIFISTDESDPLFRLDNIFKTLDSLQPLYKKIQGALQKKHIKKSSIRDMIHACVDVSILTKDEAQRLLDAEAARDDIVEVDSFTQKEYMS